MSDLFGRRFRFNGAQEAEAIAHFQKLLQPWLQEFTEDNWPTTAAHLHELLHRAMLREGAAPDWIAFAVGGDIARRAVVAEAELGNLTPEMRVSEDGEN